MDIIQKLLKRKLDREASVQIHVYGDSMHPILIEYDKICVAKSDSYCVGDILVFQYAQYELLVHRLLQIKDGRYYCKGDNSFRLEVVQLTNIYGKVMSICRNGNDVLLPEVNNAFINHSLQVGNEFERCGNDIKSTELYKRYVNMYISGDELVIKS